MHLPTTCMYMYIKLEALCCSPVILFWGNFIQNLPKALPTKFQLIWQNGFTDYFFNWPITNKVAILVVSSERNMEILYKISHTSLLQSKNSLCLLVSDEKIFSISINQKQELPMSTMFFVPSKWNEQSLKRTFHRCFLPSFGSFGQVVSEKTQMLNVNRQQTSNDGKSSNGLWLGELEKGNLKTVNWSWWNHWMLIMHEYYCIVSIWLAK